MCKVAYFLHLFGRELKIKDLGVGNDSLLRHRLGDDNKTLNSTSVAYEIEDVSERTCWIPHLNMI